MGVFKSAHEQLESIYGKLNPLQSGTGVRCTDDAKGHVTLYSKNLAPGNLAELAFEIETMALRAKKTPTDAKDFIERLRLATGQPVSINPRWKWPRVGLSKPEHVDLVVKELKTYFGLREDELG
ncbi:hypothetical protein [Metapseudomonas boanensis]|uniref:Uncharacterized protein n=1 Tax=Metapseudomonas boanensis TaxID=2822138 RepID=A0ABS5XM17_9GAMM|nr:hypothetical protein [Pseudomonas boanensis]MBT8768732.1 hypothetical protein [Pseudomonas boanensis]